MLMGEESYASSRLCPPVGLACALLCFLLAMQASKTALDVPLVSPCSFMLLLLELGVFYIHSAVFAPVLWLPLC